MKKEHAKHAGTKAVKPSPSGGRTSTGKQRMTANRKHEAVLRLMKGEDMELIARSFLGVGSRCQPPAREGL